MKNKYSYTIPIILLITSYFFIYANCSKLPYQPDYSNIAGYVIGKETCHTDDTQDYWLIDFTYRPNQPMVGDTLVFNSITYTNVLKTKELHQELKQIGMRVSIDYKIISSSKVITSGCSVISPITYPLKELFILYQSEIR